MTFDLAELVLRAEAAPNFVVRALAKARDTERLAGLLASPSSEVRVRAALALAPMAHGEERAALREALATIAGDALQQGAWTHPWSAIGAVLARFTREEAREAVDVLRGARWPGAALILLESGFADDPQRALDDVLDRGASALVDRLARADRAFIERVSPGIVRRLGAAAERTRNEAWDVALALGPAILAIPGAETAIAAAVDGHRAWWGHDRLLHAIASVSLEVALAMVRLRGYDREPYVRALLAHLPKPRATRAFEALLTVDLDGAMRVLERLGARAAPARPLLDAWLRARPNRVEAAIAVARILPDDPEPRELVWTLLRERDVLGAAKLAHAVGRIDGGMRRALEEELTREGLDELSRRALRVALRR